jgi:hypothetical protein
VNCYFCWNRVCNKRNRVYTVVPTHQECIYQILIPWELLVPGTILVQNLTTSWLAFQTRFSDFGVPPRV